MFEPVQPVLAARPTSGLIAASLSANDGARWENGMAWRPERCPTARGFDPCGDGDSFEDPPVGEGDDGVVFYRPPAFRVESSCSTRGGEDDRARATRQAEAVTSFMVARELLTGSLSDAAPYDTGMGGPPQVNARLAGPDAVIEPGVWPVNAGVARLEELARQDALGMDVFIHVPIGVLPLLEITKTGNTMYTQTGAVVVADAGYSNIGPDGDPAEGGTWAYATGPVQTRLSPIVAEVLTDHRLNTVTATAERLFAATFDPCNLHALVLAAPDVITE